MTILKALDQKFSLVRGSLMPKTSYEQDEIYPSLKFAFECGQCKTPLAIELRPFHGGFALTDLCQKYDFISEDELLDKGVAKRKTKPNTDRARLELDRGLPAIYGVISCEFCSKDFLLVFGFGEVQPGRDQCQVSGIWEINYKD